MYFCLFLFLRNNINCRRVLWNPRAIFHRAYSFHFPFYNFNYFFSGRLSHPRSETRIELLVYIALKRMSQALLHSHSVKIIKLYTENQNAHLNHTIHTLRAALSHTSSMLYGTVHLCTTFRNTDSSQSMHFNEQLPKNKQQTKNPTFFLVLSRVLSFPLFATNYQNIIIFNIHFITPSFEHVT